MSGIKNKFARLIAGGIMLSMILPLVAWDESVAADKWQFTLAPYAWLAGQKGSVATLPGLPASDIDVNFYDDVLGNINGALFLMAEARKDRWGGLMDIAYTDIEDKSATPKGILWSSATSQTKSWMVSAAGLYRLAEKQGAFVDVLGGIRYWSVDSRLRLNAGLLPAREISNKQDWIDPIVGAKGLTFLGKSKFFLSGGLVIGGFHVGSDFMWDANGNLGYQWTKTFATTVGYRYLDVDYDKDGFLYDVVQDGMILGLCWQW